MKNGVLLLLFITISGSAAWASPTESTAKKEVPGFDQSHKIWNDILSKFTSTKGQSTIVKYKELKTSESELNLYLKSLESVPKVEFNKFTQSEQLAFLINAYNAFTIKLIVDNYPVKSIKDIGSILSSPWKKTFFNLLDEKRNLDFIEHEFIRPKFNEPRIHFALVCASVGCPALRREAFVASNLESQLEDAAQNFLSDSTKNRFNQSKNQLEISSIFKWYGDDFIKKFGSVESFIAPRISKLSEQIKRIKEGVVSVKYLDYDWSLNE